MLSKIFFSVCLFFLVESYIQAQNKYYQYIDSADLYIDENPEKSFSFLKLIPEPVALNLKGKLAEYYKLKTLVYEKRNDTPKLFGGFYTTLRFAKIEKKYSIAGMACVELFYNIYRVDKDSLAFKYLEEAKKYYTLSKNNGGLAEVKQMYAYVALDKKKYNKSNALILPDLNYYKNIKGDAYYYMYVLFMLTHNYSCLNDLKKAHKYFNILKKIKNAEGITPMLHAKHVVTLDLSIAKTHFLNKQIDSCWFYLKKAQELRIYMNAYDTKDYYNLNIDCFAFLKNTAKEKLYIDSLGVLQQDELSKIMEASVGNNETLISTVNHLDIVENNNKSKKFWIVFLISGIVILSVFFFYYNKKKKFKVNEFEYLKTNHEKLKVKIQGFESYISTLKKEIKSISLTQDSSNQKVEIKKLYNDINLNSKSILDKSESHLELINELNIDFFNTISTQYPDLNASEIIICYYVFMGFKNKEIAVFINSTVRAVESKRYRINNKLAIEPNVTLVEFLNKLSKNNFETV